MKQNKNQPARKHTGLLKACNSIGGVQEMADAVGVTHRTIMNWLREDGVSSREEDMHPDSAVQEAVRKAGTKAALSRKLGVTHQAITQWLRQGWMPPRRAQEVEMAYGVPRESLVSPRVRDEMGLGDDL